MNNMETFKYYKIKTLEKKPNIFSFYFNINHGEPNNCLIVEVESNNPKLKNFSKVEYLKYNKIILKESVFYLEFDGNIVPIIK